MGEVCGRLDILAVAKIHSASVTNSNIGGNEILINSNESTK